MPKRQSYSPTAFLLRSLCLSPSILQADSRPALGFALAPAQPAVPRCRRLSLVAEWARDLPQSHGSEQSPMSHPTIKQFEQCAALLDRQSSMSDLDDAIAELAAWMDLARYKLTDDDMAVLRQVGGVLYREELRRRAK